MYMSKAKLYNQEGAVVGSAELPDGIFGVPMVPMVVRRAVEAQQRNSRQVLAHTKTRSEVRGGGRKPWRQKGTGRARHGSIRSPIWVGGGVAFGPRNDRNFSAALNRKERRKALMMSLSSKAKEEKVIVLEKLELPEIQTKLLAGILAKLPSKNASTLLVQPGNDTKIIKSARNLPKVTTIAANSLNVVDVLRHNFLVIPLDGLKAIETTFVSKKKSS